MQGTPDADVATHRKAKGFSDRFAYGFTKLLRFCADTFFAKRYGHRAVVLETVAAVPGMVGATINHLSCLRRMCAAAPSPTERLRKQSVRKTG